jgi:hypothetical protein
MTLRQSLVTQVTTRSTYTDKVFTNPDPVNRSQPELIAEQMTAQKQQANAIR